jgi:predicted O-linked N-acetylglucosamine transferase (SPINDLY family)
MLDAGCESMFTSVLCWAEEWRAAHCKRFDIGRILPFRFVAETGEYQRLLAQMHVFIDTYPCGLHTSLLEPIALCMCVVAWRRCGASWPALVASTMLEYGGYGELVALSYEDFKSKTVKYLRSKEETDPLELRMRADRDAKRGM